MIALLIAAALAHGHQCHAPHGIVTGDLTSAQYQALYAYGECVCGPQGWNDYSEVYESHRSETFEYLRRFHPSCERAGWNGRRYLKEHVR